MVAYRASQGSGQIDTSDIVDRVSFYTSDRPGAPKTGAAGVENWVKSRVVSIRDEGERGGAATDHVLRAANLSGCKRIGSDSSYGGSNGNNEGSGVHLEILRI